MQPPPDTANETKLEFLSDGLRLRGTLHLPAERTGPHLIVGSHGLYSSGESPKQVALARRCSELGVAYFRFDHRGCGRSEGVFTEVTTLDGRRNDLVDAVAFLRANFTLGSELGLFGSSFGGATCLAAAATLRPRRMVTLAAPVDSRSILASAANHTPPVDPVFFKEGFQFDLRDGLGDLGGILVIHGGCDEVIDPGHADIIFRGAGHPKKQLILPGGDHRLSRHDHQEQFVEATLAWFKPLTQPLSAE